MGPDGTQAGAQVKLAVAVPGAGQMGSGAPSEAGNPGIAGGGAVAEATAVSPAATATLAGGTIPRAVTVQRSNRHRMVDRTPSRG